MTQSEFNRKRHWKDVYSNKKATDVSWYQQHPDYSLKLIKAASMTPLTKIIDVGGGASILVDHLLETGYQDVTVLDIAQAAIDTAKDRLNHNADAGLRAENVTWFIADITELLTDNEKEPVVYDIWHDRAVFHFLTEQGERERYIETMNRSLRTGGEAIIATFDLDGPEKCSGLEIVRYSADSLSEMLGKKFKLLETLSEKHKTPTGRIQTFVYCRFEKL